MLKNVTIILIKCLKMLVHFVLIIVKGVFEMEVVNKLSKIIALGIVYIIKIIVYPIFYITKTIRIFFLMIEKGCFTVLESVSLKEDSEEEKVIDNWDALDFGSDNGYDIAETKMNV